MKLIRHLAQVNCDSVNIVFIYFTCSLEVLACVVYRLAVTAEGAQRLEVFRDLCLKHTQCNFI